MKMTQQAHAFFAQAKLQEIRQYKDADIMIDHILNIGEESGLATWEQVHGCQQRAKMAAQRASEIYDDPRSWYDPELECTCNPRIDPCPACKRSNQASSDEPLEF